MTNIRYWLRTPLLCFIFPTHIPRNSKNVLNSFLILSNLMCHILTVPIYPTIIQFPSCLFCLNFFCRIKHAVNINVKILTLLTVCPNVWLVLDIALQWLQGSLHTLCKYSGLICHSNDVKMEKAFVFHSNWNVEICIFWISYQECLFITCIKSIA